MGIRSACFLLIALAAGCASSGIVWEPVRETRSSHLGIAVEAPGVEGWEMFEKRYPAGWRTFYQRKVEAPSTRFIFLKADRYEPGGFARAHGSLADLARTVLADTRRMSADKRFQEKWAEQVREDVHGLEAYRLRIGWEERDNPHYPNTVLLMQNFQVLVLHPRNPDEIVSIVASTRRRLDQEAPGPEELAQSFIRSLRFE